MSASSRAIQVGSDLLRYSLQFSNSKHPPERPIDDDRESNGTSWCTFPFSPDLSTTNPTYEARPPVGDNSNYNDGTQLLLQSGFSKGLFNTPWRYPYDHVAILDSLRRANIFNRFKSVRLHPSLASYFVAPSKMPLALDKAYLTAIWLETLFYGINLSTFCSYLFIVKYKRGRRNISRVIFAVACTMFVLSTSHVSLGFQRLVEGFITRRDRPGGPAAFFSNVSIPANVVKVTIHTANSILGDSILVWRCYHVYGKSLVAAAFPILLVAGSAACGIGQSYVFSRGNDIHSAFVRRLAVWNGSLFSMSLATNVIVTTLIAVRIWWIGRQIDDAHTRSATRYRRVLLLIIESGAIYSSAVLVEIILYFLPHNAFYIVYDPIAQLVSIVPTMIIILTTLGLTSNDLTTQIQTSARLPAPGGRSGPRRLSGTVTLESRPQFAVRGQGTTFDEESQSMSLGEFDAKQPGTFGTVGSAH
ncbi:hypothetical protein PM082_001778 [Marasmius tenuissimus]|nr:hypothetical protein PM082_001778 [Marasmius tenuissimus]